MTAPTTRRQYLPAVVLLLALLLLTALVWWRVITRDNAKRATPSTSCTSTSTPKPTTLPPPSSVTLTVLNSTQRTGLATKVATALKKDGFLIPEQAANDPSGKAIPGVAEIRYGASGVGAAALLSYYVEGATMVSANAAEGTVVLSLGTQYKALTQPAEVTAKLAQAGIKLVASGVGAPSPTGCAPSPS